MCPLSAGTENCVCHIDRHRLFSKLRIAPGFAKSYKKGKEEKTSLQTENN